MQKCLPLLKKTCVRQVVPHRRRQEPARGLSRRRWGVASEVAWEGFSQGLRGVPSSAIRERFLSTLATSRRRPAFGAEGVRLALQTSLSSWGERRRTFFIHRATIPTPAPLPSLASGGDSLRLRALYSRFSLPGSCVCWSRLWSNSYLSWVTCLSLR